MSGNRDVSRIRGSRTDEEWKVVYAFLFTMPGVPFIYQGDEIGMRNMDGLPSKEGGYVRTGARAPMPWDVAANAGFSRAPEDQFYLPIDPNPSRPNVAAQEKDKDSLLNFTRAMIRLRAAHPALPAGGDFLPLFAEEKKYPFVYVRTAGDEKFIIAVNPSAHPAEAILPKDGLSTRGGQIAGAHAESSTAIEGLRLRMNGISFAILKHPAVLHRSTV